MISTWTWQRHQFSIKIITIEQEDVCKIIFFIPNIYIFKKKLQIFFFHYLFFTISDKKESNNNNYNNNKFRELLL